MKMPASHDSRHCALLAGAQHATYNLAKPPSGGASRMIIVTGGAGFIGSNLVAALEAAGRHDVVVVDWLGTGDKWRNLAKRDFAGIVVPEALDVFLEEKGKAVETVFHLGAISSTTETDADLIYRTNVLLSQRLWRFCALNDAQFIYASSAATYGGGEHGFKDPGQAGSAAMLAQLAPLAPQNPYGWSKQHFDQWAARETGTKGHTPRHWAGLKFFNVYGPNEAHKGSMRSVVNQLYPNAAAGKPAVLFRSHHPDYEDGGQQRDFVWVGDCVDVMLWLKDHPGVSGLFNLGTGAARSFADLAAATYRAAGRNVEIEFIDTPEEIRDRYQYHTEADMTHLRAAGYDRPFTSLEDGVGDYVERYLAQPDPFR